LNPQLITFSRTFLETSNVVISLVGQNKTVSEVLNVAFILVNLLNPQSKVFNAKLLETSRLVI
jgi:hypothetical protein